MSATTNAYVMIEGHIAYPNAKPLEARKAESDRILAAERGSQMLRDAILLAKGHPLPERKPPVRVKREEIHIPELCPVCGGPAKPRTLVAHIQATVAAYYGLSLGTMKSAQRSQAIAHPRQIAMFLASEMTPKSLPEIGRRFGGRDHTTVIHAIKAVRRRIAEDPEIEMDVEVLRERIAA